MRKEVFGKTTEERAVVTKGQSLLRQVHFCSEPHSWHRVPVHTNKETVSPAILGSGETSELLQVCPHGNAISKTHPGPCRQEQTGGQEARKLTPYPVQTLLGSRHPETPMAAAAHPTLTSN